MKAVFSQRHIKTPSSSIELPFNCGCYRLADWSYFHVHVHLNSHVGYDFSLQVASFNFLVSMSKCGKLS